MSSTSATAADPSLPHLLQTGYRGLMATRKHGSWWEWPLCLLILVGLGVAIITFRKNPPASDSIRPAGCYVQRDRLGHPSLAYYADAQRHSLPGEPTRCPFRFPNKPTK